MTSLIYRKLSHELLSYFFLSQEVNFCLTFSWTMMVSIFMRCTIHKRKELRLRLQKQRAKAMQPRLLKSSQAPAARSSLIALKVSLNFIWKEKSLEFGILILRMIQVRKLHYQILFTFRLFKRMSRATGTPVSILQFSFCCTNINVIFGITGSAGSGSFPGGDAGCTMIMDSDDFVKMFKGELNPTQAFMGGRLKMKGDMMIAMKLEKLMKTMKSKLQSYQIAMISRLNEFACHNHGGSNATCTQKPRDSLRSCKLQRNVKLQFTAIFASLSNGMFLYTSFLLLLPMSFNTVLSLN